MNAHRLPRGGNGVPIDSNADENRIGTFSPGAGNVISGDTDSSVLIAGYASSDKKSSAMTMAPTPPARSQSPTSTGWPSRTALRSEVSVANVISYDPIGNLIVDSGLSTINEIEESPTDEPGDLREAA